MEGDAGTSRLNPTDADNAPDESVATVTDHDEVQEDLRADQVSEEPTEALSGADTAPAVDARRPPRLGRGWLVSICAVLVVLATAAAAGGYLALRGHDDSEAIARDDAAALQAAKDCVSATQAPDTAAMAASQLKIIECSTGDFATQATFYSSGMMVDAYQVANVRVQVSDMRAAVERHNDDGSIAVLVAVRVKVTNSVAADRELGYRLRVQMAPVDGQFKVARLDQVTS